MCDNSIIFWSIFTASLSAIIAGMVLHTLKSWLSKHHIRKNNIALFKKELLFNISLLQKGSQIINNYCEAVKSKVIDQTKNYDANIKLSTSIYSKFMEAGIMFDILASHDLLYLNNIYPLIDTVYNQQLAESISSIINSHTKEGNYILVFDNAEYQRQINSCSKTIHTLKILEDSFSSLAKNI